MKFKASHKKIERADKHISELDRALTDFGKSDFYTLRIDTDSKEKTKFLAIDYDKSAIPLIDFAIMVGDVLHNLRSALDIMYCEIVSRCGGKVTKWTRFPIRNTRKELLAPLGNALEQKQISLKVQRIIVNTVKPYKAGNPFLWGLDDLNIMDKHQLVIPVLELIVLRDVHLEDDKERPMFKNWTFFFDEACSMRLHKAGIKNLVLKSKGHAALTILFPDGTIFESQGVLPTLQRIAKEVTRTLNFFEVISFTN
jgi:hypothetical protein